MHNIITPLVQCKIAKDDGTSFTSTKVAFRGYSEHKTKTSVSKIVEINYFQHNLIVSLTGFEAAETMVNTPVAIGSCVQVLQPN